MIAFLSCSPLFISISICICHHIIELTAHQHISIPSCSPLLCQYLSFIFMFQHRTRSFVAHEYIRISLTCQFFLLLLFSCWVHFGFFYNRNSQYTNLSIFLHFLPHSLPFFVLRTPLPSLPPFSIFLIFQYIKGLAASSHPLVLFLRREGESRDTGFAGLCAMTLREAGMLCEIVPKPLDSQVN